MVPMNLGVIVSRTPAKGNECGHVIPSPDDRHRLAPDFLVKGLSTDRHP